MFFKQIWRNAARSRKGNGLFYGSLTIAIVAFYTLLSLEQQDVMRFLNRFESDAVQKLMMLIPVIYVISLFFVFFLVYFACRYQTDSRSKEFGVYLMLGMKRSRLFVLLFCETLWSSLISLLIGLPIALLLTEGISLATAKLVGLGIIGHQFTFSFSAVCWTIGGFVIVQLLSILLICRSLGKTEPAEFIQSDISGKQRFLSVKKGMAIFILGILLLLTAYTLGILFLGNLGVTVLILLAAGTAGTFLLYQGLGSYLGEKIRRKSYNKAGLSVFTGRQLQENVFYQHRMLAISSLLLLMALSSISYGIGIVSGSGFANTRTTDFSLFGTETEVQTVLKKPEMKSLIEVSYPVYLALTEAQLDTAGLTDALGRLPETVMRNNLIENMDNRSEYILAESSFNHLMVAMGKKPISLKADEIALYSSMSRSGDFYSTLDAALKYNATIKLKDKEYKLLPDLFHDNIVADRAITLYAALIVPDGLFMQLTTNPEPFCWNVHLQKSLVNEIGLMQAIEKFGSSLDTARLEYESYLGGIGRNLFYTVAASYLTIYLGILFLLIANTVIGLKYLIQQRQNKHRYITLMMLGADLETICNSAKKQIQMFFTLVLGVAVIGSIAAIFSMFTSLTKLPDETSLAAVMVLAALALVMFTVTEFIYITIVKRTACQEIRRLEITDRG